MLEQLESEQDTDGHRLPTARGFLGNRVAKLCSMALPRETSPLTDGWDASQAPSRRRAEGAPSRSTNAEESA